MDYIALYRKWRPMTFDEVVEQDTVVTILKNTVKSRRIGHAYLFSGTRGTGKTSVAKIFSRAINCLNPVDGNPCNQCEICRSILSDSMLDVAEIDAASNNGIDAIREIIDVSSYQASRAEYKVFIIDEVHMLSISAFNALLKTLEEPPEKVVFILATTEPQKIPVTILSRCQRYNFKRISRDGIVKRLEEICEKTGLQYETAALRLIAGKVDGGMRDAISLLDQTIAFSEGRITLQDARKASGAADSAMLEDFTEALLARDGFKILTLTDEVFASGADPSNFISEIIGVLRSIMICLSTRNAKQFLYESEKEIERLKRLASFTSTKEITMLIKELSSLENRLKWSIQRKIVFEAGLLSLCDRTWTRETDIADRVETLEKNVADLVNNGLRLAPGQTVAVQQTAGTVETEQKTEAPGEPAASEAEEEPELTRDVLSSLTPVDNAIWTEYLAAVRESFPGVAGILSTRGENTYIIGNSLYIVLGDLRDVKPVTDGKRKDVLTAAAARVFNRRLSVKPMPAADFYEQAPDLIAGSEGPEGEAQDTAEIIAEFAETNGISFEVEGLEQDAAPEEENFGTERPAVDRTGYEPNEVYSDDGTEYEEEEDGGGYGDENGTSPQEQEEEIPKVIVPEVDRDRDELDVSFGSEDEDNSSMFGGDDYD
ncbi:MAG: DNA polymerase III subunit gamma/tau [Clostridia bacterium]|nr:DNA polymerase III subunit gamma/tau [Clostridia bacterium]